MTTEAQTAFEVYDAQIVTAGLQSDPREWTVITAVERDAWAHVAASLRREAKVDRKARASKAREAELVKLTAQLNLEKAKSTSTERDAREQRSEKGRVLLQLQASATRLGDARIQIAQEREGRQKAERELAQFGDRDDAKSAPAGIQASSAIVEATQG